LPFTPLAILVAAAALVLVGVAYLVIKRWF
jgi:hypothetical protein